MNRLDIIHAHYLFNKWNYSGQGDAKYARYCRISRYYKPARSMEDAFENLEQVAIYETLLELSGKRVGYTSCLCCSNPIMGMGLCSDCATADCSLSGDEVCNCECREEGEEEGSGVES